MKKHFPHISAFILTIVIIFAVSGFVFPKVVSASHCEMFRNDPGIYAKCKADEARAHAENPPSECGPTAIGCQITQRVVPFIVGMILKLVALLTGLAGIILNGVIYLTIVKVSENYGKIPAINEGWKVIRNLANMGFIFILLYAAIQTILGIGSDTKKLIVNVVIVAVLINFSLFFTKMIIDASNILTLFFYDAIAPGATSATGGFNVTQAGLSNAFMKPLGLQSLYKIAAGGGVSVGGIITIGVMGSIMLLVAAFVFFAVAIMLIIRYVILILVLILSPLAFLSFILPQLKKYRDQWWNTLSGQAFFAPIYFMLTLITLSVLDGVMKALGTTVGDAAGNLKAIETDGEGNVILAKGTFDMFLNFSVIIVFLIASLIIAKEWANKAGSGVSKLTSWAAGAAGGATFGLAGRAGRLATGRFTMSPDSEKYKNLEKRSAEGGMGGAMARLKLATIDKARSSSFDIRGSRIGGVLSGAGLEAGQAGGKGGFEAERKAVREFLEKPGTEAYRKRQERGRKAEAELDIAGNLSATEEFDAINAAVVAAGGVETPAQTKRLTALQPQVDKFEKAINKSTTREIEVMVESNRKLLASQEFANRINVQQLDALNKSDRFTETEKDVLKARRFETINTALATGGAGASSVSRNIKVLSNEELEMINPEHLGNSDFVSQMRGPQFEFISRSNNFTSAQKQTLKDVRIKPILQALDASRPDYNPTVYLAGALQKISKMGGKDFVELMGQNIVPSSGATPISLLTHPQVLPTLKPNMLKKMVMMEMDGADITTLRTALLANLPATHPTVEWLNNLTTGGSEFA